MRPSALQRTISCACLLVVACGLEARVAAQCYAPEHQRLLAVDGAYRDNFGRAVSIYGDRALIGAFLDDNHGSVYSYRFDGSTWVEDEKLMPADRSAGWQYGIGLAQTGDLAAVGADHADGVETDAGAVYMLRLDAGRWIHTQKLVAGDGQPDDLFGRDVAIHGDFVVVGAGRDDDRGRDAGAAYVFRHDGASWREEAKLELADGVAWDHFGSSVAVHGDRIVVGGERYDGAAVDSGCAVVYRFDGSTWAEEQRLLASDAEAGGHFGAAVGIRHEWIVVGAPGDASGGNGSGALYFFRFDGTSWIEKDKRWPTDDVTGRQVMGASLSLGDRVVVAGAPGADDSAGAAYVFRYSDVTRSWYEEQQISASDRAHGDNVGISVAMHGEGVLMGATGDDDRATDAGSALAFSVPPRSACRKGTVGLGHRITPLDVLMVNGRTGSCVDRLLDLETGQAIEVRMATPQRGPRPAPFALYAWIGEPGIVSESVQPHGIGMTCLPTFISIGVPKPHKVWNNAGHEPLLGTPDFDSKQAPSVVVSQPRGVSQPMTVTLQGIIADDGSAASVAASVTNAIVIRIE